MSRFMIPPCDPQFAPPTDVDVPFEGVEKRLVIHFKPKLMDRCSPFDFTRAEWQSLLDYAHCEIVSERHLADTKVYLLSESTLTVWPHGFLLKTCGRTTPFLLLDVLAKYVFAEAPLVDGIDWLLYSRLDFLHPQYQVWPHQSHQQEAEYLKELVPEVDSFNLPAGKHSLVGFVYSPEAPLIFNFDLEEALMMQIDRHCVRSFAGFDTPEEQQFDDGNDHHGYIRPLLSLRQKELDEFWFSPFGYSSNALAADEGDKHATYFSCHVSPEPETSYASLEVGGRDTHNLIPLSELIPAFDAKYVHITKVSLTFGGSDLEDHLVKVCDTYQMGYHRAQSASVILGHMCVHHIFLERPKSRYLSLADCPLLTRCSEKAQIIDQLTSELTTASGDDSSDKVNSQD